MAKERLDAIHGISWRSVKGDGNNDVEAEQHGAFEVVGLAVLDGVGDDEDGDGKSDGLDWKESKQLAKNSVHDDERRK